MFAPTVSDPPPSGADRKTMSWFLARTAGPSLSYVEFQRVEIRVGRIVGVEEFPAARKPAYQLRIDFGADIGVKRSSAQVTKYYTKEQLLNRLVVAVVNFPPKQIGPYMSEVLTLGVPDSEGDVVLLVPERDVPIGGRMF
jgi:tRNA-binding protein